MKTFLTRFFVTLGVIFFLLICAGAYVWVTDTYGVRTIVTVLRGGTAEVALPEDRVDKNPVMNEQQEAALEAVGIDPASVPTSISPSQEDCFVEALGQVRVDEIKAGDTPTATEIVKGRECM
jgi:hypothetical protein